MIRLECGGQARRAAGGRVTGPRKTAGGQGCSVSGGGFQAGESDGVHRSHGEGGRAAAQETKMTAVRLPSASGRTRPLIKINL